MKIHTPFIDHVIAVSSRLKKPTAKLIVTRMADDLLQRSRQVAELELTPIIRASIDDSWVQESIKAISLAKDIVGTRLTIDSFDEAWSWLLNVIRLANATNSVRGVDETLMFVHRLVSFDLAVMDFDLMDSILGE